MQGERDYIVLIKTSEILILTELKWFKKKNSILPMQRLRKLMKLAACALICSLNKCQRLHNGQSFQDSNSHLSFPLI